MIPVSTFAGGPEAIYRLTQEGDQKCMDLQRPHWNAWSAMARRMRRAGLLIASAVSAAVNTAAA